MPSIFYPSLSYKYICEPTADLVGTQGLDLQRTVEAVQALGESHKESIELLQTLAASVIQECSTLKSQKVALQKQKDLEDKTAAKERERAEKAGLGQTVECCQLPVTRSK